MAKRRPPSVNGFVVIDKPAGMTSHDVVAKLRKRFNEKRVGHAGTLDPDATGVLLVGVGYVTRLMTYLSGMSKSYVGEVVLGSTTTTLDDSGETTATFDMSAVTLADVEAAASRFVGEIEQIPPMVSALKVDGMDVVACHDAARGACDLVRDGNGPVFVEFQTYRYRPHSMFDAELYRDKAEVEHWKTRGPIHTFSARLKAEGRTPHEEIIRVQLNRVKQLLTETDLSMEQIAERTGFAHVEYLSVVFKKKVGQNKTTALAAPLSAGKTYRWLVKACNAFGCTRSARRTFRVT